MGVCYSEIEKFLNGFCVEPDFNSESDRLEFYLNTYIYQRATGEGSVLIAIQVRECGRVLEVVTPLLYQYKGPHLDALFSVMIDAQMNNDYGCYLYNHEDGEVRYSIALPIEDGVLTPEMLRYLIGHTRSTVELLDPFFRETIATGKRDHKYDLMPIFQERKRRAANARQ